MKRTATLSLAALAISSAASADIFNDIAKDNKAPRRDEQRAAYYESLRDGEKPSVESVRDFLLPRELDRMGLSSLKNEAYFQVVMPYFYGGLNGEKIRWSPLNVQITKYQQRWCLEKKESAFKAMAELNAAVMSAPVGQYGERVHPQAQQNHYDAILGGMAGICMGVDPSGRYGNQVWTSMQSSIGNKKKGGF